MNFFDRWALWVPDKGGQWILSGDPEEVAGRPTGRGGFWYRKRASSLRESRAKTTQNGNHDLEHV